MPPAYSSQQKKLISDFCTVTGADRTKAARVRLVVLGSLDIELIGCRLVPQEFLVEPEYRNSGLVCRIPLRSLDGHIMPPSPAEFLLVV
jgi:hypothetical protein